MATIIFSIIPRRNRPMEKKNSISTIFIIAVVLLVVIAAAAKITSSKSSKTEEGTGTAAMTEYWTEGSAPARSRAQV